ncbi:TIGR04283 family arsenosugar biosynthesis glycosyltransferase [Algoriphagus sp.]|uniref:TIGR04283 family arsenosugar biosynthesis glycosyltransferase n=1 Tax=Algoriphagus sp. TaxID=1872435 RepID=UPI00327DA4F7
MTDKLNISVIIPCLNEAENLSHLLPFLLKNSGESVKEIILVDGGSTDDSVEVARSFGILVLESPLPNRAVQLNLGASRAKSELLYFLHADTRPCEEISDVIVKSASTGIQAGCFRLKFDSKSSLLRFNSWYTRFNGIFSGGGDQSLFITKDLFDSLGGYDQSFCIMEDFDLTRRIRQKTKFHVLPFDMKVSARKYQENSWLRVQLANSLAFSLFLLKIKPATIKSLYLNFLSIKKYQHNSS